MKRLVLFTALAVSTPTVAAPSVFDSSGIKDWSKAPEPTTEPTFKPPVAQKLKLKNGVQLLVIENHELPIVSLALVVPGAGYAADPKGKGGLASFTADLLDEGAGGLSAIAIAEDSTKILKRIGPHVEGQPRIGVL